MKNLQTSVIETAKEAIFQATCEAGYSDRSITLEDLHNEIEAHMNCFMKFENATAKGIFFTCVLGEVKKLNLGLYEALYPPQGMDQDGNYTTDRSKWA